MTGTADPQSAPISAYLLADHLDAALAAGEDLLATCSTAGEEEPQSCGRRIADARAAQRHLIERIRGLELALVSRCLRARERARELATLDVRFEQIARLFAAGTAPLVDAIAECSDATSHDFETGDGILAYLRRHAVVPAETESLGETDVIGVDEDFLVARRVALGPLLDLLAAFLDALDLHFELYEIEAAGDSVSAEPTAKAA